MLLTEEHASQLVAEWTKDCARIVPMSSTLASGSRFTHPRMVVEADYGIKPIEQVKTLALSLRRAMEGLNVLACCTGFDPEENPAFWRRELRRLERVVGNGRLERLTSDLFSRYNVTHNMESETPSHHLAWGLATCLSDDAASLAMDVRRQVIAQVQDFLLSPPPPLDLQFCAAFHRGPPAKDNGKLLVTIDEWWVAQSLLNGSQPQPLRVVIGHEDACFLLCNRALEGAIRDGIIEVTELHGLCDSPHVIGSFQGLLNALCESTTLEAMSWGFGYNVDFAVELFSSLPYMRSLRCLDLWMRGDFDWLAFALKSRQMRGLELSLSICVDADRRAAFVTSLRYDDESTFARLIPEGIRTMVAIEYYRAGTSAVSVKGAELTQDLLVVGKDRHTLESGGGIRYDVLARCGYRCILVVPTYGLMWVQYDALGSWQWPPSDRQVVHRSRLHTLVVGDASPFQPLAHALQELNVVALAIDRGSIMGRDRGDEALELASLDSTRTLVVPGTNLVSLDSVLSAAASSGCKLETLETGSGSIPTHVTSPSPFFDAITHMPMWQSLRELSVGSRVLSLEGIEALAAALANNRHLRFLRLCTSANQDTHERLRRQFARAIGPTDRSKVSLYAFLLSVRRSPRWQLLPLPCQQLAVAFAAVQTRRQVVFR